MLGNRKHLKRRLEDDLPQGASHNSEWTRCMEGFSDTKLNNGKTKRLCTQKPSCKSFLESSFDHVVDFGSDASGQNDIADAELISWSSSEGDSDVGESNTAKKDLPKDRTVGRKGRNVSKENSPTKKRIPKASKLELQRVSPSFDRLSGVESDGEINSICSSSDVEEDKSPENRKPSTHLKDFPKQTSPVKKSRSHNLASGLDSPAICSFQSGLSSNSDSPGTSGLKASDWVKAIDWQTPVKAGSQDDGEIEPDSAKKKRVKYKKDGLASQLSRLQTRERTAVRIWEHQKADDIDNSLKACLVQVLHFEALYSLQLAHCKVARIQQSHEGEEENIPAFDRGDWKSQIILFSKHMMERLQIEAGTLIKVYPPWQELQLTSLNKSVLLCTNYCRVVSPASSTTSDDRDESKTEVITRWNCPCSKDPSLSMDDCVVKQMPYYPSSHCTDSQQSSSQTSDVPQSVLQTVTMSGFSVAPVCDSLLEAIQKTGSGRSLCFKAVVQRVFRTNTASYSLLVEDSHGTMAVVQMGDNSVEDSVKNSEGKTCTMSGLKVVTRSNKERNHLLFSVIEGAWSGHMAALSSQESQDDEPAPNTSTYIPCPGFCYILAPAENARFSVLVSSDPSASYRQPQLSTLAQAKQMQSEKRVSFLAGVIYKRVAKEPNKKDVSITIWYVTDKSLVSVTTVTGISDCHIPTDSQPVALFMDVLVSNGKLHADGYTRIRNEVPSHIDDDSVTERYQQLKGLQASLPTVTSTVQPGSLVSIAGVITSIDEDAAYSWEECDRCGSDKLTEEDESTSTCVRCQRRVTSPVTKMKMEVYVRCEHLEEGVKVKVDLLQSTVEKLLPSDGGDEGYDIDSVLNKEIGPIQSLVKSVSREAGHVEIYLQEFQ